MAGARQAPRALGSPRLLVLLQASGERCRGAPARRPGRVRCGPSGWAACSAAGDCTGRGGRIHQRGPGSRRRPGGRRRAEAPGAPAAALPRGAAALGAGRAPATSRRRRRRGMARPAPSAGSGQWHLQPRRRDPSAFTSLLLGSNFLPRPRRTGARIAGRRQRRGASVSHGGASRPRRRAPEAAGG